MIVRLTFKLFLVCLVLCASLALGAIWTNGRIHNPLYFQTTATLFVVGLASFLIWFSLTLRSIRAALSGKA